MLRSDFHQFFSDKCGCTYVCSICLAHITCVYVCANLRTTHQYQPMTFRKVILLNRDSMQIQVMMIIFYDVVLMIDVFCTIPWWWVFQKKLDTNSHTYPSAHNHVFFAKNGCISNMIVSFHIQGHFPRLGFAWPRCLETVKYVIYPKWWFVSWWFTTVQRIQNHPTKQQTQDDFWEEGFFRPGKRHDVYIHFRSPPMCAASWKFWNSTGVKDVPAAKATVVNGGFCLVGAWMRSSNCLSSFLETWPKMFGKWMKYQAFPLYSD